MQKVESKSPSLMRVLVIFPCFRTHLQFEQALADLLVPRATLRGARVLIVRVHARCECGASGDELGRLAPEVGGHTGDQRALKDNAGVWLMRGR
jgi:hypothetical protein